MTARTSDDVFREHLAGKARRSRMATLSVGEILDDVQFGGYWPEGTPDMVRDFLTYRYDRETMPALLLSQAAEGEPLYLLGWRNEDHPRNISLLEAVRGYAMTVEESEWARSPWSIIQAVGYVPECLHRPTRLRKEV